MCPFNARFFLLCVVFKQYENTTVGTFYKIIFINSVGCCVNKPSVANNSNKQTTELQNKDGKVTKVTTLRHTNIMKPFEIKIGKQNEII